MREKFLTAIIVLLLGLICFQIYQASSNERYEVVTGSNMLTILVDKKTGNTWRNCICGEKSQVPGCWEKMITINPETFNKPEGEVVTTKKMIALQKKQLKLQEKLQKTQPSNTQPANTLPETSQK